MSRQLLVIGGNTVNRERHAELAKGDMPFFVLDYLKEYGWAIAQSVSNQLLLQCDFYLNVDRSLINDPLRCWTNDGM